MHSVPLLDELGIVAALAVLVTVILTRLRLPTVAGFLLAGALLGPYGFKVVSSVTAIEQLAEVGVVLLLFTIGLEFSLARLRSIFRRVALGGFIQVSLTTTAIALGAYTFFDKDPGVAVFYGFVFALSSTAIVLRTLTERRELNAPHGRFVVGTLIFQDLCVVPMVLVVPLLGSPGHPGAAALEILIALGKAAGVVVATIAVARYLVPRVLDWVNASNSRELFLLAILALCIGTAWLTQLAGLSLALGAFLAGMTVADTQYGRRAMSDVLPLKDAFVSLFFISLGMLFDVNMVLQQPLLFFGMLAVHLFVKGFLATVAALAMRFPLRVAWLSGVGLAQFGEFGFVLAGIALKVKLVDPSEVQSVISSGIASMFLTVMLIRWAPQVTAGERILAPLMRLLGARSIEHIDEEQGGAQIHDHVILIGFGAAGMLVARSLATTGIPYLVLELDAERVKLGKKNNLAVYYGDGTSLEALEHAHIDRARALVLLMNDTRAAHRVIDSARRLAPHVPVLMRARFLDERQELFDIGVREVIVEEVEGAVEIIARALRALEVPRNVIDERIREIREQMQASERTPTIGRPHLAELTSNADFGFEILLVEAGSAADGKNLIQLNLRARTGALVIAVKHGDKLLEQPSAHTTFAVGDVVYLVGAREALHAATPLFIAPEPAAEPKPA